MKKISDEEVEMIKYHLKTRNILECYKLLNDLEDLDIKLDNEKVTTTTDK